MRQSLNPAWLLLSAAVVSAAPAPAPAPEAEPLPEPEAFPDPDHTSYTVWPTNSGPTETHYSGTYVPPSTYTDATTTTSSPQPYSVPTTWPSGYEPTPYQPKPSGPENPFQAAYRAHAVKQAFEDAWEGYYKYAFPNDELLPVTNGYGNSR